MKDKAAFPTMTFEYDGQGNVLQYQEGGVTLRQWYAGMAMQGMLAACGDTSGSVNFDNTVVAKKAFRLADAMLAHEEDKP